MTEDLIFYDPDYIESCVEFCEERNISYLPHVDGSSLYKHVDEGFERVEYFEEFRVQQNRHIFDQLLKKKLEDKKVLFVYDGTVLKGVIHFADYNSDFVYKHLYDRFFELENSLRNYLKIKNLDNQDLLEHLSSKRGLDEEDRKTLGEKMSSRRPFQEAGLKDLFDLINSHNLNIDLPQDDLRDLRNQVMHEKQFVEHKDFVRKEMHYDLDSFGTFFERVQMLRKAIRKIKNKTELENQVEP